MEFKMETTLYSQPASLQEAKYPRTISALETIIAQATAVDFLEILAVALETIVPLAAPLEIVAPLAVPLAALETAAIQVTAVVSLEAVTQEQAILVVHLETAAVLEILALQATVAISLEAAAASASETIVAAVFLERPHPLALDVRYPNPLILHLVQ